MQTRASLLLRIKNANDELAWSEFVQLYAPLLYAYAIKNKLQDADASDLAQDTLRHVLRAAPGFEYDPQKGSFRGWLFTIARNEIRKFMNRKVQMNRGSGESGVQRLLEQTQSQGLDENDWNREYQLNLFHWAAKKVEKEFRPTTWTGFWRTVVLSEPCEKVAQDLGVTVGSLYISRSRVTARIRTVVQEVEANNEEVVS